MRVKTVAAFILFMTAIQAVSAGLPRKSLPVPLSIPATEAARQAYRSKNDQADFLRGFRYGYVEALINESYTTSLDKEKTPYALGYQAAKKYVADLNTQRQPLPASLAQFGYQPYKAKGTFSLGFEKRNFLPHGGKEPFWVRLPQETKKTSGDDFSRLWKDGATAIVQGWLSPEGMYGHFGGCRRQLVVYGLKPLSSKDTKKQ